MASGDAQKVWFNELKAMLAAEYNPSLSLKALIILTSRLDATLQKIRSERNIITPMIRCPKCKAQRSQSKSIRARRHIGAWSL